MSRKKVRYQLFLDAAVSERLEALAAKPGSSASGASGGAGSPPPPPPSPPAPSGASGNGAGNNAGASTGAGNAPSPAAANAEKAQPEWAKKMQQEQRLRGHLHTAQTAVAAGDQPIASANPDISQKE